MSRCHTIIESLRPNVCSLGYALFLAVNATGIWGGVFPFLPLKIQTSDVMFWFYLAQCVALFAVFIVAGIGSVRFKAFGHLRSSARVLSATVVYFTGWVFLIAAMYVSGYVLALAVFGGVFLGSGAGLFYLLWQRLFASWGQEQGFRNLIAGFVYAAVFYACLYLIPHAVTAFLIPLVFLPLFSLSLILGNRTVDYSQPMFSDDPLENLRVYRKAFGSMWRSALCMGALAFCAGIVRSVAVEQPEVGAVVNLLSMAALFVVALAALSLWRLKGLRMNLIKLYQFMFPVLITAFALLPVFGFAYLRGLAAVLFALYSIGLMLTMMQCMQISNDRGVGPSFVFGLFGAIVYGLHDVGFIVGSGAGNVVPIGISPALPTSVLAIYLLALMFFVASVNFKGVTNRFFYGDTIELLSGEGLRRAAVQSATDRQRGAAEQHDLDDAASEPHDRLDLKVDALRSTFQLSNREAEVVGLIVHGNTVPRVAEKLFISENTVRTHTKRIYSKLGVHKKQELIELVENF